MTSTKETIKCPICKKRIFDIVKHPADEAVIEIKCPHCRQVVTISLKK